jgi:integrase
VASIRSYATAKHGKRWEVRWRDAAGRDRSKVFAREGDARRFKVDVERRQQLGPLYDARRVVFAKFFEGWRDRYEQRVRPATFERGMQAVKHLGPFMPLYVDQVTGPEVEDLVVKLGKTAPRQGQIALALLKQILRNASERGHVVDEGVFRVGPPKQEEREPRFLTWVEVEDLASMCAEGRLVVLACLTGLRQGELFALRDLEVDLDAGVLLVTRAAYKGEAVRPKTRKSVRRAYLSGLARQALREQLLAREPNREGLVFPSPAGGIWQRNNFMARVFRPAVRRAELDGLTFHDLRHTCASLLIATGANPLEVAAQLGHKDARLVFQRYGHLYPGAAERAVQRLDALTTGAGVGEAWGGA